MATHRRRSSVGPLLARYGFDEQAPQHAGLPREARAAIRGCVDAGDLAAAQAAVAGGATSL